MTNSTTRLAFCILTAAGVIIGAAACSGDKTVSKTDVASQISSQLAGQVGHKPDSVTCPDDLKASVGASQRCELTDQGAKYGVTVTVSSVDGDNVKFDIKVDDKPE